MSITPWFSRTFEAVPAELLPCIVERLRGTPARLEERVRGLPPELRTRRVAGRWSVQENVGHLLDLEPLWLGRVGELCDGAATLRPADLENRATHAAGHNGAPLERLLSGFREQRGRLVAAIEAMTPAQRARTARHPRLDRPMSVADLAAFVAEHDDHHLARIGELLDQAAG